MPDHPAGSAGSGQFLDCSGVGPVAADRDSSAGGVPTGWRGRPDGESDPQAVAACADARAGACDSGCDAEDPTRRRDAVERSDPGPTPAGIAHDCIESGSVSISRTESRSSRSPTIPSLRPRCGILSVFIWTRPTALWCFAWTRRARFRLWTGPLPCCRCVPDCPNARPMITNAMAPRRCSRLSISSTDIASCLPRHRGKEFVKFLDQIEKEVPADLEVHLVMDNYSTHRCRPKLAPTSQAPTIPFSLYAHQQFLAQSGRTFLCPDHPTHDPARYVPQCSRAGALHLCLARQLEPPAAAFRLEGHR